MDIYCRCYCSFVAGKAYMGYDIEQNKKIIIHESKTYKTDSEYEGYLKVLNYLILKIEKLYCNDIENLVVIMLDNKELISDLNSDTGRIVDIDKDNNFSELYNSINTKNIKIELLNNESDNIMVYKDESLDLLRSKKKELHDNVKILLGIVDDALKKDSKYYSDKISELDLMVQDILHFIESRDFSFDKKAEYIDSLKKIRQMRRDIKNDREIREQFRIFLCKFKGALKVELRKKNNNINISDYEFHEFKRIFSSKEARNNLLNYL